MRRQWSFLLPFVLTMAGCGYVGDPRPPALQIPVAIEDLRGLQRGGRIYLAFTPSLMSTDQVVLKRLSEVELRAGENKPGGFDMGRWLSESERVPVEAAGAEATEISVPASKWVGKEVIFAVRSIGPTGRGGQWSNLLLLNVTPPPETPADVTVAGTPQGLLLQWKGGGTQWRVWRLSEGEKDPALIGAAGERSWLDRNVEYGKTYSYMVQQLAPAGAVPAESEMSRAVESKFLDRFPPAVPAGLAAITGLKSVELNWDRNTEPDWKAYQVFRAAGDQPLLKLNGPVDKTSFSDTTVESGKKYRYAVASIDEQGNQSEPCTPVEIVAP